MTKKIILVFAFSLINFLIFAQETEYKSISFSGKVKPILPSLQDYTTFDLNTKVTQKVEEGFISKEEADKIKKIFSTSIKVPFAKYKQIEANGDFHVITLITYFSWVKPTTEVKGYTANISGQTTVYDKFGAKYEDRPFNYKEVLIPLETVGDNKTKVLAVVQKAIGYSLSGLIGKIYGFEETLYSKIAYVNGVKKKSPLKQLESQFEQLKDHFGVFKGADLVGFLKDAKTFLPYWEELTNYKSDDEDEVIEAKRAAYQNLSTYYLITGDFEKAKTYIEPYKLIDKTIKEMMGMVKYKNSEETEATIIKLNPTNEKEYPTISKESLTLDQMVDLHEFYTIEGKFEIESKLYKGIFDGKLKIVRPEPEIAGQTKSNMIDLSSGGEDFNTIVEAKNSTGELKKFEVRSKNIKWIKDNNGLGYKFEKFGVGVLGTSVLNFMKETFTSPKVKVYSSLFPEIGYYHVIKTNDEKGGVRYTDFNFKKNILEYFADCPSISIKYKDVRPMKFDCISASRDYSDCK